MYPNGAIETENSNDGVTFKVNGQILKLYLEYQQRKADTKINLSDPPNFDQTFLF